jgi:hypothetical protein
MRTAQLRTGEGEVGRVWATATAAFFLPSLCPVRPEYGNGLGADADDPGPAALGGALHPFPVDDGGRAADQDLGLVEVDVLPSEVEQLPAPRPVQAGSQQVS